MLAEMTELNIIFDTRKLSYESEMKFFHKIERVVYDWNSRLESENEFNVDWAGNMRVGKGNFLELDDDERATLEEMQAEYPELTEDEYDVMEWNDGKPMVNGKYVVIGGTDYMYYLRLFGIAAKFNVPTYEL